MGSPLDKELRIKYGRRTIEIRKGDEVKIMRGKFSGKQGKVGTVDVGNTRIQVDGIQRVKKMGGEKMITWFHPSKVKIIILNTDDKKRLKRSKKIEKIEKVGIKTEEDKKEIKTVKKVVDKTAKKVVKK